MTTSSRALDSGNRGTWHLLETKRHCEARAQAYLASKDIVTYLPRTHQWPRPAVGAEIGPMFPGYLFVRLDLLAAHRAVASAFGVKKFVAFGDDGPAEVPAAIIEILCAREDETGLVRCEPAGAGDRVKIARGPLKDYHGVVAAQLTTRERVVVLMELLQRDVRVEVPTNWIQRA